MCIVLSSGYTTQMIDVTCYESSVWFAMQRALQGLCLHSLTYGEEYSLVCALAAVAGVFDHSDWHHVAA